MRSEIHLARRYSHRVDSIVLFLGVKSGRRRGLALAEGLDHPQCARRHSVILAVLSSFGMMFAPKVMELIGNTMLISFTAPKILWVRQIEPDNWEKLRLCFFPNQLMAFR
jgi:sugar (pentulose or hexulose) kinase